MRAARDQATLTASDRSDTARHGPCRSRRPPTRWMAPRTANDPALFDAINANAQCGPVGRTHEPLETLARATIRRRCFAAGDTNRGPLARAECVRSAFPGFVRAPSRAHRPAVARPRTRSSIGLRRVRSSMVLHDVSLEAVGVDMRRMAQGVARPPRLQLEQEVVLPALWEMRGYPVSRLASPRFSPSTTHSRPARCALPGARLPAPSRRGSSPPAAGSPIRFICTCTLATLTTEPYPATASRRAILPSAVPSPAEPRSRSRNSAPLETEIDRRGS